MDQTQEIEQLKAQIKTLTEKFESLMSNVSFPSEIERALFDRGFIKFDPITTPALNGDTVLFQVSGQGFVMNPDLSINVAAAPFRYLKVPINVQGSISEMYIPLYIFGDTV